MDNTAAKNRSLTLLIPVHNEAKTIRPFLDELYTKCLNQHPNFEVLMLEDGSTDTTRDVLQKCQKEYKNLIAHTEPTRIGYRASVTRGIERASKEWILLMDGDGQIEPSDIWALLESSIDYDIVIGEKFPRCDPMIRIFVSRVFDVLTDIILGVNIRDINFGFKLMRATVAKRLAPRCNKMGEIYTAELVLRFVYDGCRLQQIPVRHRKRTLGTSTGIPPDKLVGRSWRAFTGLLALRRELTSGESQPSGQSRG